jgi:hypothetical protein
MYEFNHIPIKIMELDRECYANIELDEIMLTSYPPQYKTIVTIELDFILLCEKFYTVQIKNDIPRKYYAGNMSNKLIMCEMDDRTLSEWAKAIINSEKHDRDNPLNCQILPLSPCQNANKTSECDHDFEKCEISNSYNYDFNEFKSRNTNQLFHPYYCKKCGILILKKVVDNARGVDKFLWEE